MIKGLEALWYLEIVLEINILEIAILLMIFSRNMIGRRIWFPLSDSFEELITFKYKLFIMLCSYFYENV